MRARRLPLQATIVTPDEALPIRALGLDLKVLLTTEATGGAVSVFIADHKPGEGPPDHVHFNQGEIFFIVDGTYELTVGNRTATVGPATIAFIPRKIESLRAMEMNGKNWAEQYHNRGFVIRSVVVDVDSEGHIYE